MYILHTYTSYYVVEYSLDVALCNGMDLCETTAQPSKIVLHTKSFRIFMLSQFSSGFLSKKELSGNQQTSELISPFVSGDKEQHPRMRNNKQLIYTKSTGSISDL